MTHDELMAGADALNAYYKASAVKGFDIYDALVAADNAIDSYESLLSEHAEMAGCYEEWDERRCAGLEEA